MIKSISKDTLRHSAMLFNSQWLLSPKPFSNYVCPAKRKRQKRYQLLQAFRLCNMGLFQTKPSALQTSEQRLNLPSLRIINYCRLTHLLSGYNQVLASTQAHPADIKLNTKQTTNTFKRYGLTDSEAVEQAASGYRLP